MQRLDAALSPLEVRHALNEAKGLAAADVPIFVAPPCPPNCPIHPSGVGFHLPTGWQHSKADPAIVDLWRPGWALCALGGHAADWLDVDPRNGGTVSASGLKQAGMWPTSYGEQATPSDGTHHLIAPLRTGKANPAPGIDLQGGRPDGTGVGFVFLSPTVRASKIDGKPRAYRWVVPPDLIRLAAEGPTDDTGAGIAGLVPKPTPGPQEGPFTQASSVKTPFTRAQAVEYCKPHMDALHRAQVGEINTRLNTAAKALSHFGDEFWVEADAHAWLHAALDSTEYDENGDWLAQTTIDSAYRSAAGDWKAVYDPGPSNEAPENKDEPTYLDKLRSRLVTTEGLDLIPQPSPVIAKTLFLDSIAWLCGAPGDGKSFIALDMAGSVGTGETWQGLPTQQGDVLYLVAEGLSGIRGRVRAWESATGKRMNGVTFLPEAVQSSVSKHWDSLVQLCEEIRPKLIILDTQARITLGMEENSAKDMGHYIHNLDQLRKSTGACVLSVHHTGRSGEMRGSTVMEGAATTIIKATKVDEQIEIECVKQKDAEPFDPIKLRLTSHEGSAIITLTSGAAHAYVGRLRKATWMRLWWDAFRDETVAVSTLLKAEIVSEAVFYRTRYALIEGGVITRIENPRGDRYRLNSAPPEASG